MNESFKLTDIDYININNGTTFARFVSQLQKSCPKLLCMVNDTNLYYYSQKTQLPKNISYVDYKIYDKDDLEYYFINNDNNDRYTIFGTTEACVFYPDLYKILNLEKKEEEKVKIIEYVGKEKYIILYHHGDKLKFPFSNKDLSIIEKDIFNHNEKI
jgi:hypothetical protein